MLLLRCSPWLGEHRSDNVIGLAVGGKAIDHPL
jgi:hypothetical protein